MASYGRGTIRITRIVMVSSSGTICSRLVFSLPAIALIVTGYEVPSLFFLRYVGFGVTAYGVFYLLFHDVLVHQRIPFKFKAQHPYLKRMIRAHYLHHAKHTKEDCEAFGFLYAPSKFDERTATKEKSRS